MMILAQVISTVLALSIIWSAGGVVGAATQAPSPVLPSPQQGLGHEESQPQYDPLGQQAASIQALTSVGSDLVYAGSFGLGLFRSEDRGVNWAKSDQGVTDPFILTLTTGKDGAIYAGTGSAAVQFGTAEALASARRNLPVRWRSSTSSNRCPVTSSSSRKRSTRCGGRTRPCR